MIETTHSSTICAPSTSIGGAIGVIRISGQEAIAIADKIFSRSLASVPHAQAIYGHLYDGNNIVDDVVTTIFRAPHSYTGEDTVEISHHGSPYIQQAILQLLIDNGCSMATPGEYTQRAFMNGKMDLSQAEAVADLIASNNAATHRIAMQQMRGSITTKLATLREQLLHLTTMLELELDFSDHEDLEFVDRLEILSLASTIESEITNLSNSFKTGNALKNGVPVAIIGAPNVGKSTLLNLLLGEDRAIVSDIQGTTRDVIEDSIIINGTQFRFIDTAGIRQTDDTIESLGIERSLKAAKHAHIIIMLTEPGVDFPDIEINSDQHVIYITNKTPEFQAINGTGLDYLYQQLIDAVPTINTDAVIITNQRHKEVLDIALADIRRSIEALKISLPSDLVAEELRQCIYHLSEITGSSISSQEILNNIFSKFCIGK